MNRHLEMMESPDLWPHWPLLPLKQEETKRLGVLMEIGKNSFPFAPDRNLFKQIDPTDFHPARLEQLIAEGWVVN